MKTILRVVLGPFRRDTRGQDLSEYCLLVALVALVALAVFVHASGGIESIWSNTNTTLANGSPSDTSGSSHPATASTPAGAGH